MKLRNPLSNHTLERPKLTVLSFMGGKRLSYGHPEPDPIPGKRFLEVGDGHFAWVDEADYDFVKIYRWALDAKGEPKTQLPDGEKGWKAIRLKAMLLDWRVQKGHCIKYLDGNTLNNSRDNLKVMTLKEARALDREILGPQPPRTWKVKNPLYVILDFEDEENDKAGKRKAAAKKIWE